MDFLYEITDLLKFPPYSSLFIIFISIIVSIFTVVATYKMSNTNKLKNYAEQTRKYKKIKISALKTRDKDLLKFVKKNDLKFNKIQKELFFMRLKPTILLSIPMILVFIIMNGFFGGSGVIVAILPFNLWDIFQQTNILVFFLTHSQYFVTNFMTSYFLVNFLTRSFTSKLLGLDPN